MHKKSNIEIIFKSQFRKKILKESGPIQFISTKRLSLREIRFLRKLKMNRFYLPRLGQKDRDEFFSEFDKFWDGVVSDFGQGHPFWLNIVSSKMQEWENSAGYLALVLFTLSRLSQNNVTRLLVITSSLEEEEVWRQWSQRHGWRIVDRETRLPIWISGTVQRVFDTLKFIYYAGALFRNRRLFPKMSLSSENGGKKKSVLIASLSYPWSFKEDKYRDPFFGDLHRLFQQNDKKCVYLSDLIGWPDSSTTKAVSKCSEVEVFFPSSILTVKELTVILWQVFSARFKFAQSLFLECDFSRLLSWNAHRSMCHHNIHAQVYYRAVDKLCARYSFDRLLYIFEGNVFERACIQAFRRHSKGRVDGYSHAAIYEINLKLRLTEGEKRNKPEADRYICPGPYAKKMLSKIGGRPIEKLDSACTLKEIPPIHSDYSQSLHSKTLLVGLDGLWISAGLMDWLMGNASCLSGFTVVIREHPNLPIEKVLKRCIHTLPSFFKISKGSSLEEDIKKSFCVLYHHTSIGMQALLNGIPVIHLAIDTPLSGDPVEGLSAGKWVARNSDELRLALRDIRRLDSDQRDDACEKAKNFAEEFFSAPTDQKLKQFIEA